MLDAATRRGGARAAASSFAADRVHDRRRRRLPGPAAARRRHGRHARRPGASTPYIRESRRIQALTTVASRTSPATRGADGASADSVGIGMYRIDLHPSTGGDNYIDLACAPVPDPARRADPAARRQPASRAGKNIGTTHITNGAYRLHPVEWNAGEAAGHLAAFCAARRTLPRAVHASPDADRASSSASSPRPGSSCSGRRRSSIELTRSDCAHACAGHPRSTPC